MRENATTEFLNWVISRRIRNERGDKIEFDKHFFLLEPYGDWFPSQVCMKSAQVGWSTLAILKSLYALRFLGLNAIYTLPAADDVRDFVPAKVDGMINNNPALVELLGKSDAISKKQIGNNYIWYRGTFGKKQAIMHSSDLNIYDEYDACNPEVIDLYTSRLQYSEYKGEWKFSNPIRPGGIDAQYELSDQRKWLITCSRCNFEQELDYFKNVDLERRVYVCSGCREELREEDRHDGRWVPMKPSRSSAIHGYHVNQLMAPWVSATELIRLQETKGNAYFYNMVLGLPFVDSMERVDRAVIVSNFENSEGNKLRNAIGVDVKYAQKHYVIGNRTGVFKVGVAKEWKEIEELIEKYNCYGVVDCFPDFYPRQTLIKKYPGKVFACIYKENTAKKDLIRWGSGDSRGFVHVDRDEMIQYSLDQLFQGKVKFNIGLKPAHVVAEGEYKEFIRHFENLFKVERVNRMGVTETSWDKKGPDDFVHAFGYFLMALSKVPPDPSSVPFWKADFANLSPEIFNDTIPAEKLPVYAKEEDEEAWLYS